MLFNSYEFLLGFYPVVFFGFFLIARYSRALAALWLGVASLYFYGYWRLDALPLLVGSICVNYWFGLRVTPAEHSTARARRLYLLAAVTINLAVLAYFKYANFLVGNLDTVLVALSRPQLHALDVVLPIGISFFTFTQIAFLVDCHEGKVRERKFTHYLLFVSYFPHLISGPVLHHSQMMPQFRREETYRVSIDNVVLGLFGVAIGLAKKVLLADQFSLYASPVFDAARDGYQPGLIAAWTGALAYTAQIYFDFSGYTDMALGLSRMLGIVLPLNFNSPYKAASIIDFWRRWHMSLSQFLRDYLYFRLGGNRRGPARRYLNLMLTMLLGGLWHGASWTFVAWGGLHGLYLLINHAWRAVAPRLPQPGASTAALARGLGTTLTFLAVVVAWVFFRSTTFVGAVRVLRGMIDIRSIERSAPQFARVYGTLQVPPTSFGYLTVLFAVGFGIIWLMPTSQDLVARLSTLRRDAAWTATGALLFTVGLLAVINASQGSSEFIYFNF
jgi:alginate O-acetyltransferase complex protein AlgI